MMRMGLAHERGDDHFGGYNCNELPAGSICGVPIKFSIYLVLFLAYSAAARIPQLIHMGAPWWAVLGLILGGFLILILTILVHEFGHGLTARRLGGEILYILLWPLGGLCFHTMPRHHSKQQKLQNDWWVTFNGPCTHLLMVPCWAVVSYCLYCAFGLQYSALDFLNDLNPLTASGSRAVSSDVVQQGWGAVLLLQLCSIAIHINVILFLFNILFPMFPMDSSKLLVTGLQLCGMAVQRAAWSFIYVSGTCAVILLALAAYNTYVWVKHSSPGSFENARERLSMGFLPIPLHILLMIGLGFWGGKQTYELYQLATDKQLHRHPLFCHVDTKTTRVRDIDNGRPDLFVEKRSDDYWDVDSRDPVPDAPQGYGAVQIIGGQIVRQRQAPPGEPQRAPQAPPGEPQLPRQDIVRFN